VKNEPLESIDVTTDEFQRRVTSVPAGARRAAISRVLGGEPFQHERRGELDAYFWRFRLTDSTSNDPWQIYLAELKDDCMTFGFPLPQG